MAMRYERAMAEMRRNKRSNTAADIGAVIGFCLIGASLALYAAVHFQLLL